jgi:hypothetical protein
MAHLKLLDRPIQLTKHDLVPNHVISYVHPGPALRFWWSRATLKIKAPYNICTSVIACISLDAKLRIVT